MAPSFSAADEEIFTLTTHFDASPVRLQCLMDIASRWEGFMSVVDYEWASAFSQSMEAVLMSSLYGQTHHELFQGNCAPC